MLVFLKKIIFFTLPVLLLFALPAFVIFEGREYFSIKDVVEVQLEYPESIFGFAYNDISFYPYKELLVTTKNPKVVALGTSRVMQFREQFFTKESQFINAGGAGKSLADIERFISGLPDETSIKVIVLGLDKELFTSKSSVSESEEKVLPIRFVTTVVPMSRRIYLDYFTGKLNLEKIREANKSSHAIGISGMLLNNGFRSDGSYQYAGAKRDANRLSYIEDQFRQSVYVIKSNKNKNRDEEVAHLGENIKILERTLYIAQKKGITVVGIMPPYPSMVHEEMLRSGDMLPVVRARISGTFEAQQLSLFDFSSIEIFGGKDTEFVDGIHGTDLMYLKMMFKLKENKDVKRYISEQQLKDLQQKAEKDFLSI